MFLPYFDIFCDLLVNRRTATWTLFVQTAADKTTGAHTSSVSVYVRNAKKVWENIEKS